MATPQDNTEVVRMLRDVKNSIWKSLTPRNALQSNFKDYVGSFTQSGSRLHTPISCKLNFSNLDDTRQYSESSSSIRLFETPESLKRKLVSAEAELQASKAKLNERESLINVLEPANKKMCLNLENKKEECKKQKEMDFQQIEELQSKLNWAKKQLSCAQSQIKEVERQKKIELDRQELRLLAVQQEVGNLKVEVADVKSEKTEAVRKLNVEIGKLELKVSMMSEEAEKSQEYIQSLKRLNNEMAEKVALCNSYEKELKEAQYKIQTLENKIEADKDAALIVASRHNDLKSLNELQKENRVMREELNKYRESNVLLYQEKMWSLQEKLNQAEKKCFAAAQLQAENEQLKAKIAQWEELFDDKSTPYKSPTAFSRRLSEYQQNEAHLTNKLSQLSSHCESLEKQITNKEEIIKSLHHQLESAQSSIARQDSALKRFQRKLLFVSKEKDNCRKLLDSYLSEATVPGIALHAAQINHLEEMNAEYKKALEKSDADIEMLNEKLRTGAGGHPTEESASEMKKLKDENASMALKLTQLQNEMNERKKGAPVETGGGTESHRVLHLRMNPVSVSSRRHLEHYTRLQEENDQLKKRIAVLEEEGAGAEDVTRKVEHRLQSEGADSAIQVLKQQLASSEKKIKFILESAKSKSTEFREAVYLLTGYRIDVPTTKTYKLSHIYADSRDDFLLFKIDSGGIQLVETAYSQQVQDKMELYLQQHDSFPAFLASLTMDLFNQQTFMVQQG